MATSPTLCPRRSRSRRLASVAAIAALCGAVPFAAPAGAVTSLTADARACGGDTFDGVHWVPACSVDHGVANPENTSVIAHAHIDFTFPGYPADPYSATGTADATARFGRLTAAANGLVEQAYANPSSDTTPNVLASVPADIVTAFEDRLTFSTGSTAQLEFRVGASLLPGCGTGTGFNCDVVNAKLTETFHVDAGSGGCQPSECPIVAQLNLDPAAIEYQVGTYTNPCSLDGYYCGILISDPIPLGGSVQINASLLDTIGLTPGDRTDYFTFNTGGSSSGSLELVGIDLFDAQGQPIQDFSVVADSGTVYHAPEPSGAALGAIAAASLAAVMARARGR